MCNDFGFSCLTNSTNFVEVFFSRCKNTLIIIGGKVDLCGFTYKLGIARSRYVKLKSETGFCYIGISRSDMILMAMEEEGKSNFC